VALARHLPKFLEPGELRALLDTARESSPRDYALILCMSHAGLRVSEACALRWDDIADQHLLVRKGKGDKQRYVPLHPRLKSALAALRLFAILRSQVFPGRTLDKRLTSRAAELIVERLCAQMGIAREKAHPHTLRHTFATNVLRKSGNLLKVQRLLGHASVKTTEIYTHLVFDDLAEAIGLLD